MDEPYCISTLVIIWLLLLSPLAPLGWLWAQTVTAKEARLALTVLTASYAWLLLALVTPSIQPFLLGSDYSYARTFAIPCANIAVAFFSTAFLVLRRHRQVCSFLAGVLVVLCWVYLLLISSVV